MLIIEMSVINRPTMLDRKIKGLLTGAFRPAGGQKANLQKSRKGQFCRRTHRPYELEKMAARRY